MAEAGENLEQVHNSYIRDLVNLLVKLDTKTNPNLMSRAYLYYSYLQNSIETCHRRAYYMRAYKFFDHDGDGLISRCDFEKTLQFIGMAQQTRVNVSKAGGQTGGLNSSISKVSKKSALKGGSGVRSSKEAKGDVDVAAEKEKLLQAKIEKLESHQIDGIFRLASGGADEIPFSRIAIFC
jgi:hypothetical protein